MKVVKIDINDKVYGGRVYENEVVRLLEGDVEFKRVYIMKSRFKILNLFRFLTIWFRYKFFFSGVLLLTNATTIFAGLFSKNIAVIHHIDSSLTLNPIKLFDYLCDNYLFIRKRAFNKVIVVSSVWEDILASKGFHSIEVIYNSFNPDDFVFSSDEIHAFKKKYGLMEKPIIFLGNGIKGKGADRSYDALKDMDVHFVTSGKMDFDIPVKNVQLEYSDYKLLLASADVVLTMSEFNEGWNRVAHEASLCGTPVIGSGKGGMKELLNIANQTVSDFEHLKENVITHIGHRNPPTERLKSLNLKYFKEAWIKVFESI